MSFPYRLGSSGLFSRNNEETVKPKRVIFLSTEGSKTEVQYFNFIEKYREQLGIKAIVHVEVLRKFDTRSDPDSVLDLLEEYIQFRENGRFEDEIASLSLRDYTPEFIRSYLYDRSSIPAHMQNRFQATLTEEHLDLVYLDFLSKFQGEDDVFGVVVDRDSQSHSVEQMQRVIKKCRDRDYFYFITNPCIELWLLLHVADIKAEYLGEEDQILENRLDKAGNTYVSNLLYKKTSQRKSIQEKVFQTYYLPNVDLAIMRAKALAPEGELIEKIGSNLYVLFELMRST